MMMDLLTAVTATNGMMRGENVAFSGVSTDSRTITVGDLFVALRGEHFDGHEFIVAAKSLGASAALVDKRGAESLGDLGFPLLIVEDTRLALGVLAAFWRKQFSIPVVAVTGSNGKTTSKEMITCIMKAAFGEDVLATQGNLNNDIGMPLTLLKLRTNHRAAVIEMGMNNPGEIAYLAQIARPTVALVTNAQRAHLAGMGSIDSIAREKGSLYEFVEAEGVTVINADDPWAELWRAQSAGRKRLEFSFVQKTDIVGCHRMHGLESRLAIVAEGEEVEVVLAMPGVHNARNALGAATVALAAGLPLSAVKRGLEGFRGVKGRLQSRFGVNGALVLDDTYNANPDSVRAGIDVLAATIGKKILVLGDMGEIGEMTGQFHDEVGGYAKSQGLDRLFTLGESSALAAHNFGAGARHFKKLEELVAALVEEMTPDAIVLVKGSRFMRMERVVDAVIAEKPDSVGVQAERKD